MSSLSKIAITMGDSGGIGPEVIMKALLSPDLMHKSVAWIVLGTEDIFRKHAPGLFEKINFRPIDSPEEARYAGIYFLDTSALSGEIHAKIFGGDFKPEEHLGEIHSVNACSALASLQQATELSCGGMVDGLVTAPIHKKAMRLLDPDFCGHTEFLAKAAGIDRFAMSFVSERLKVTLVTIHIPLKDVSACLTQESIFDKILLTHEALMLREGLKNPKIAVCALNPHGGETGTEEHEIIEPAVERAIKIGVNVCGPLSADQLFYEAYQGHYDALISMYHDQALGPFKMIAFHDGVNVTLGLPFVRTSPDHGTAFDIAGQNKANPRSMFSALQLAAQYCQAAKNSNTRT